MAETVSDVAAFSTTGKAPKFIACASCCASACVRLPEISPLPSKEVKLVWVG